MSGRVAGKAALVTGAAQGLGEAIARMLAKEGAKVALTDVNGAGAEATAASINETYPGMAFGYAHDVRSEEQWVDVVARAASDMGSISILVNNAGVGDGLMFAEQDNAENWQRQFEINLRSIMFGAKHCLSHLRAARPASIVNISSIAGLAAAPGMGAYNATKAGVWMYSKTLALEEAKLGSEVRCNSVHPVFIKTAILDPFVDMAGGDEAKAHERLMRGIPMKRIGEPDDVAWCVLYLASDESKFVTGAEFKIDGGTTAQ